MITLGIDIGKKRDPSAMVLLEGVSGRTASDIVGCRRIDLDMSYDDQADVMAAAAEHADLVMIDATGVGEAVCDMVRGRANSMKVWAVVITGGKNVRIDWDQRIAMIPKKTMVAHLGACLDHDALVLKITDEDELITFDTLADELRTFHHHGNGKMDALAGKHDDLVMALCLALMGFKVQAMIEEVAA